MEMGHAVLGAAVASVFLFLALLIVCRQFAARDRHPRVSRARSSPLKS
jgi:hypothetical protein